MKDRRPKSRRPDAGLAPLPPEQAAALEVQVARLEEALAAGSGPETLPGLLTPEPHDLAWDLHLLKALARIPHPQVPLLLAALFGPSADKERRKALKRTLHILKTRGVSIPDELFAKEEAESPAPVETSALQAQVSPVMGNGERYVMLEGPPGNPGRQPPGGPPQRPARPQGMPPPDPQAQGPG